MSCEVSNFYPSEQMATQFEQTNNRKKNKIHKNKFRKKKNGTSLSASLWWFAVITCDNAQPATEGRLVPRDVNGKNVKRTATVVTSTNEGNNATRRQVESSSVCVHYFIFSLRLYSIAKGMTYDNSLNSATWKLGDVGAMHNGSVFIWKAACNPTKWLLM